MMKGESNVEAIENYTLKVKALLVYTPHLKKLQQKINELRWQGRIYRKRQQSLFVVTHTLQSCVHLIHANIYLCTPYKSIQISIIVHAVVVNVSSISKLCGFALSVQTQ